MPQVFSCTKCSKEVLETEKYTVGMVGGAEIRTHLECTQRPKPAAVIRGPLSRR
jgi:hypothetical protein